MKPEMKFQTILLASRVFALRVLFGALLALAVLTMTADAHALMFLLYDSRDVGCGRMSDAGFFLAHFVAAIPVVGGIIVAWANDCNIGGWAYWVFAALPVLGLCALPFFLVPPHGVRISCLALVVFSLILSVGV